MTAYTIERRTKEIGIRKVLGATLQHIIVLLTRELGYLLVIAALIALPLAFWLGQQWLDNYLYRVEISWWTGLLPLGLMVLITGLTIGYQTLKTARANPTDALRYE